MPHRQRPLRLLFTLLSIFLLAAFLSYAYSSWREVHNDLDTELSYLNRILNKSTNDILSHYESVLRILGDRLIEAGAGIEPEKGRYLLDELIRVNPELAGYGLARNDGQLLIVSAIPAGEKLPSLTANPDSAATFMQALDSRWLVVGRTYYFDLLQKWIIPIRIALHDRYGQIPFVMSSGVSLDTQDIIWNAIDIPEGSRLSLVRSDGYYQMTRSAQTNEDRIRLYNSPLDQHCMKTIIKSHETGNMIRDWDCDSYTMATYIPAYDLYSVLQTDISHVRSLWLKQMILPTIAYILLFSGSVFAYRITKKMQTNTDKERAQHEQILLFQATHDALTLLPNRMLVMDRLEQAILESRRTEKPIAILFLDLDNFKTINDSLGHITGDDLLKMAADRLRECLRATDTVARLGGDEFLLLLRDVENSDAVSKITGKILERFRQPFHLNGKTLYSTATIGISMFPGDGQDANDLLMAADTAMYEAKDSGRNQSCFYSSAMNERSHRRMEIESHLRKALENNEIFLAYQPQIRLHDNRCNAVEVLARWENPELGLVSPVEFIPVAEETGLINDIGLFVLEQSIREISQLEKRYGSDIMLAINVSASQLQGNDFLGRIENITRNGEREAGLIECEITESMVVDKTPRTRDALKKLYDLGVKIAIDDFGTGYSSLSYLAKLSMHTLKIDRSFIYDTPHDFNHTQLTRTIIAMGKGLGLEIVAEGIENEEQKIFLNSEGCDYAQGFLFARPMKVDELAEYVKAQQLLKS